MTTACVNGTFVDAGDAMVSAADAGLLHGVGLFETMLGVTRREDRGGQREIIDAAGHVQRLKGSADQLGLARTLYEDALIETCEATFERSGLERARVRLTLTGGDLNLLHRGAGSDHRPTVIVTAHPATVYPEAMFERGVMVTTAEARANPLDPTAGHKTLNYWWRLRELQAAAGKGAGEALVFQVTNHLAGGCVSNALLIKDGRCVTPIARGEEPRGGLPSPVLPGVTRSMALGWLEEMGIEVDRRLVTIDDVLRADEVMLTNSSWGVLPVVAVEATEIGDGKPGAAARSLMERWGARVG